MGLERVGMIGKAGILICELIFWHGFVLMQDLACALVRVKS